MAFSFVIKAVGVGIDQPVTNAVDTTGANLIVICVSSYTLTGAPTDSKSNTWTLIGSWQTGTGANKNSLHYCVNPTVGTNHTFTFPQNDSYSAIMMAAFSGAHATPLDQNSGASTAQQAGSVTPSQDNELLVAGHVCGGTASNTSIDQSFIITDNPAYNSGINISGGLAYLIQTTAAARNPTWTDTASTGASNIATFKAAAAAGIAAKKLIVSRQSIVRAAFW